MSPIYSIKVIIFHNPRLSDSEADLVSEKHYERLCRSLRKMVQPFYIDLADQAAGETLMNYIQRPDRYKPERGDLWSYLFGAGRRNVGRLVGKARIKDSVTTILDPHVFEGASRGSLSTRDPWVASID